MSSEEYRVYDDIFALLHDNVQLRTAATKRFSHGFTKAVHTPMKQIFVTSFNLFKKALTYDRICDKVWPHREHILVVLDEVDDFLDRDKLVFNICSNRSNAFDKPTLEHYFEVSRAVYKQKACPDASLDTAINPAYWKQLFDKYGAIHRRSKTRAARLTRASGSSTRRRCGTARQTSPTTWRGTSR